MKWLAAAGPIAVFVALLVWAWRTLRSRTFGGLLASFCRRMARLRAVRRLRARYPRLWAFLLRRVTPAGVFGLHLTIGLAVSVLALGAFIKIAVDVLERDDFARVDGIVAGIVASHLTPTEVKACQVASAIGAPVTIVALGAVVALVLITRRRRWLAGAWVATLAGGGLLNYLLKAAFHRTRPLGAGAFLHYDSWSFPSGHTMGATVAYGMLAFLLLLRARDRGWSEATRTALVGAASLVVALIGASRICLGVHYTTDVIGALAAGAMWLAVCISGLEELRRREVVSAPDTVSDIAT